MADGRIILERQVLLSGDAVVLANGGEQFGLFDGVYAEVRFHVEVQFKHVFRIAGLVGDHVQDLYFYRFFVQADGVRGPGGRRGFGFGVMLRLRGLDRRGGLADRGGCGSGGHCRFPGRRMGRFPGCPFILEPQGVESHFQLGMFVPRYNFKPGGMPGFVLYPGFPFFVNAFDE